MNIETSQQWIQRLYVVTLIATAIPVVVTRLLLHHPAVHEVNPIAEWGIVTLGWVGVAVVAFTAVVAAFWIYGRCHATAPRVAVAGGASLASISLLNAVNDVWVWMQVGLYEAAVTVESLVFVVGVGVGVVMLLGAEVPVGRPRQTRG